MSDDRYAFDDSIQAGQFHQLLIELRCMTCPNQSLIDSNLPVALDLKNVIYHQIRSGSTPTDIKHFLVARYGDSILYDPPLQPTTVALWLAPWLMLGVFLWMISKYFRRENS